MAKGHVDDNSNGYKATPSRPGDTGEQFNGDWPSDGFILPGTATANQGEGTSVFQQGSNGRGNVSAKKRSY